MLEQILTYINHLDPFLIVAALFFFAFVENIFPPSPSDIVIVVGATIVANTAILFLPILIITSFGSSLGFILMYYLGNKFGEKVIRTGRLKFVNTESLNKTDMWFAKYGYKLIFINRFLPGTRAVISFFCGIHRLKVLRTFLYAAASSFMWYALLIYLGIQLERKVQLLDFYLETYSNIILAVTVVALAAFLVKYLIGKRRTAGK